MQSSSFNQPNAGAPATPPVPPVGAAQPVAPPAGGLPPVSPPAAVPASGWLAATDPNAEQAPADTTPNSGQGSASPQLADDGDLIEKEWVMQVKRIVQATANDPFEQNVQLTKLKADYMQKRYGKQIRTED